MHENHNFQFCRAAEKKKYDCETDRKFIICLIQNEAQTHVAQEVSFDDFISGRVVSAGCEESRLQQRVSPRPSVRYGPEPARASPLLCRASRARQVRPRAGPGESSLSASQSRPPTGRPLQLRVSESTSRRLKKSRVPRCASAAVRPGSY